MRCTTRQPTINVEELFPFLKGTARKAIRLHPRLASNLHPDISKIGGAFVWPKDEPVPICSTPSTPSCRAVPVIQLLKTDFPSIEFPSGSDLFQLLWYPGQSTDWGLHPKIEIFWRDSSQLSSQSVIAPVYQDSGGPFVIRECKFSPEEVIEYPYIHHLSCEQMEAIREWEKQQDDPMADYLNCLSTCPGTKIGGYSDHAGQDGVIPKNTRGEHLHYLLTLSDDEWDGGSFPRWRPIEQQYPPGRTVIEEQPDGRAMQYTTYTPEEELELAKWTDERWDQYHDEQSALGTYLKYSLNVFLDKSTGPWRWRTA